MTRTDEADSLETWLSALRDDVEAAPAGARRRTAQRLTDAGVLVAGTASGLALGSLARPGLLGSRWLSGALWLPVGIAIGAGGHAWLVQPARAPAAMTRALPTLAAPALPAAPPLPVTTEAAPALAITPQASPPKARAAVSATEPQGLERELLVLEQARTRLSEGQANATLELLRTHRSTYPSSALAQERDALAVRALVAAGRVKEARQAAEAFVQRFPGSVLRGSVERAVGTIP